MPDRSTTYLGVRLRSPLVPSASPLSANLDGIREMEDAGAGAIVLPSLFEEQLASEADELDFALARGTYEHAEATRFAAEPSAFTLDLDSYLALVGNAKAAVDVPIIASLNGVSPGGWTDFASAIEDAGADALELNIHYLPTDPLVESATIENDCVDVLREVWRTVNIPIAVKLSPFYTNLVGLATRLDQMGARGLVLFNRFYQPDVDLERMQVVARADLSTPSDPTTLRVPLRWIGLLFGRVDASLAGSGGVHSAEDALKLLAVGADVAMLASELIAHGMPRLAHITRDLERWLDEHGFASVRELQGTLALRNASFPSAFERLHYVRAVASLAHIAAS